MQAVIADLQFEVIVTKSHLDGKSRPVITEMKYRCRKTDSKMWTGWFTASKGHRYFNDLTSALLAEIS